MATQSSPHHSFDTRLAKQFSIEEAILIHHFQHWITVNHGMNQGFREGLTWTYQTLDWMKAHFPYWSVDQIRRIIVKLEKKKVLRKGNFNEKSFDHTVWYALEDQSFLNYKIDMAESPNRYGGIAIPIPDTKENTHIKENTKVLENSRTKEISPEIESFKKKYYEEVKKVKPDLVHKPSKNWDMMCKKLLDTKRSEDQLIQTLRWSLQQKFWQPIVLTPNGLWNNLDTIETQCKNNPTIEDHEFRIKRHKELAMKYHGKLWRGEQVEARENAIEFYMGTTFRLAVSYAEKEEIWLELTGMKTND
jgi:hypothetical protein